MIKTKFKWRVKNFNKVLGIVNICQLVKANEGGNIAVKLHQLNKQSKLLFLLQITTFLPRRRKLLLVILIL